jgi:nucleoside-triphosphatase THEP1
MNILKLDNESRKRILGSSNVKQDKYSCILDVHNPRRIPEKALNTLEYRRINDVSTNNRIGELQRYCDSKLKEINDRLNELDKAEKDVITTIEQQNNTINELKQKLEFTWDEDYMDVSDEKKY